MLILKKINKISKQFRNNVTLNWNSNELCKYWEYIFNKDNKLTPTIVYLKKSKLNYKLKFCLNKFCLGLTNKDLKVDLNILKF